MAVQEELVGKAEARLDREAEAVRTAQLERALSRLRAGDDLTDEQRAAVEALSERLVAGVLATPRERLRQSDEDEAARAVLALFG